MEKNRYIIKTSFFPEALDDEAKIFFRLDPHGAGGGADYRGGRDPGAILLKNPAHSGFAAGADPDGTRQPLRLPLKN